MLRRRPQGFRPFVVALILASLGLQVSRVHVAARGDRRAGTEITTNVAVGDILALPAQRADGQITITTRERSPEPLVAVGETTTSRSASRMSAAIPCVHPHARSHAARLRVDSADDPPLS